MVNVILRSESAFDFCSTIVLEIRCLSFIMSLFNSIKALPVLAGVVLASASYPAIPTDLTTPVQQRIAVNGANGKTNLELHAYADTR